MVVVVPPFTILKVTVLLASAVPVTTVPLVLLSTGAFGAISSRSVTVVVTDCSVELPIASVAITV